MSCVLSLGMPDRAALTVNLREMAELLRLSTKGMRELLARSPELPVLSRGSAGIGYRFDPAAVIEFVQRKRATPRPGSAATSQLALFACLPCHNRRRNSTGDRMAELKLLRLERLEIKASSRLVVAADVQTSVLKQIEAWEGLTIELLGCLVRDGLPGPAAAMVQQAWAVATHDLRRELARLLMIKPPGGCSEQEKHQP